MLGIKGRDANRKIEACEGAPDFPRFFAKLLNEQAGIAHRLGSEGRVTAIRAEGRPGAPSLVFVAAPVGVIDHSWLDRLCSVRWSYPKLMNLTLGFSPDAHGLTRPPLAAVREHARPACGPWRRAGPSYRNRRCN